MIMTMRLTGIKDDVQSNDDYCHGRDYAHGCCLF